MQKYFSFIALLLLCSSCATVFNGKNTRVNFHASENTKVKFNTQTYNIDEGTTSIFPRRSKDSLKFIVLNDSISTAFAIKRKTSALFFLNLPYTYGLGLLVDLTNEKRFTYKRNLYIKIDSTTQQFYISKDKIKPLNKGTTLLYTSPLQIIDVASNPMLTVGAEYFVMDNFSLSAEYGTIYTERQRTNPSTDIVKNKGRSFRYELKYYNLVSIFNNPKVNEYIGLEARFLRHQFTDDIRYGVTNEEISFTRNEDFIVQKSVDIYNIKYGLNFPIGEHLFIDLYTGFGARLRDIKNPNRFYNPDIHDLYGEDGHFNFHGNNLEESNSRDLFNFSLGFKFGIRF